MAKGTKFPKGWLENGAADKVKEEQVRKGQAQNGQVEPEETYYFLKKDYKYTPPASVNPIKSKSTDWSTFVVGTHPGREKYVRSYRVRSQTDVQGNGIGGAY